MEQDQRKVWREERVYMPKEKLRVHYLMYETENEERTVYDLEIRVIDPSGWDECLLRDVATTSHMAQRIWMLFVKEMVMPVAAQDILEELLSDAKFLYDEMIG